MKIIGIIAEYDPFHAGHKFHIERSLEATGAEGVVAIMSGNFTQRGEPAIFDKWKRAQTAVIGGVDLVLELPFLFACSSAEGFACGGVNILDSLKEVKYISFGSESGDIKKLTEIAALLADEQESYKSILRENLDNGSSFAKARSKAVTSLMGSEAASILEMPNNILAVEYLKIMKRSGSSITPLTVKRKGEGHNDRSQEAFTPSARAIRHMLYQKHRGSKNKDIIRKPQNSYMSCREEFKAAAGEEPVFPEDMFDMIRQAVITMTETEIAEIYSVKEGLENKIKSEIRNASSYDDLVKRIYSKRCPESSVKRILVHIFMNIKNCSFTRGDKPLYSRVLAFNEKGARILRQIKNTGPAIDVLTNINKDIKPDNMIWEQLIFDVIASDLYGIILGRDLYKTCDMLQRPRIVTSR